MSTTAQSARELLWASLTEEEREVYRRAGYHREFGLGRRPALLVVDVEYNFTGDVDEPILDSMAKYSDSCGPEAWAAIPVIARALAAARRAGLPVIFTHGVPGPDAPGAPRIGTEIVDELAPMSGEYVVAKDAASAFHQTGVAEYLARRGVDTVIHVGCTTSGCVRASVVDAAAHGFKNAVVEDGVFDRAAAPHRASLFDMDAKYADVVSSLQLQQYLSSLQ